MVHNINKSIESESGEHNSPVKSYELRFKFFFGEFVFKI